MTRVSVAVPVWNEQEVLPELVRRLQAVLSALPGGPHEVLFVDDGSTDRSVEVITAATAGDSRFKVISLSRNFGHQAAICAGLDHATGDVVIVMDGDLQDTPETIPRFLEKHREGFDVVYARRVARKEGVFLRLSYWLFYRVMAFFSNVKVPVDAGDFSLMSRRVVDAMKRLPERLRYVRGLRAWVGFKQTGIEVERAARAGGEPKYDAGRLFNLAFDGIFAFSVVPLRVAAAIGLTGIASSSLYAAYAVISHLFFERSPTGFTALISAVVFLSGVQLLFLGVIGEYVGRVYEESKGRPTYVVGQVLGGATAPAGVRESEPQDPRPA